MLTTRCQPLGAVWPEMDRLQEEMEQWLTLHIDSDKVAAEIRHGVLTITLPKRKEAKARRIVVKAVLVTHNLQDPQSWLSCAHFQAFLRSLWLLGCWHRGRLAYRGFLEALERGGSNQTKALLRSPSSTHTASLIDASVRDPSAFAEERKCETTMKGL